MLKDLRVVFMGTPEFSENVLKMLIENTFVVGVVTQPDKVAGRGNKVIYSPVKKVALDNDILVLQPNKIKKEYSNILSLKPDIIITCAYGQIIPEEILNYPRYGCINVHASLLPKLRGGAPIHHAIIDGFTETGITIMYMDKGMDTGDIIAKKSIPILDSDDVGTLHDKLSVLGSELLKEELPKIISFTNERIKQDSDLVTYAYNIPRSLEKIDFNKKAREVFNQVRGLNPFPGSYLILDGVNIKIHQVSYEETDEYAPFKIGEIVVQTKKELGIKCINGIIYILKLQKENKKALNIVDYLNGEHDNLLGKVVNND